MSVEPVIDRFVREQIDGRPVEASQSAEVSVEAVSHALFRISSRCACQEAPLVTDFCHVVCEWISLSDQLISRCLNVSHVFV